ncbi:tyrosine-protein phosphatase non-receptor type 4-like isoform X2 [Argonauta hians]
MEGQDIAKETMEKSDEEALQAMSIKLVSSGSYNVRASEMAHDRQLKTITCLVHFLDDTEEYFEIDKRSKAQALLEKVYDHLELIEKDYFGLQFLEVAPTPEGMRWVDPLKTVKKQCRGPTYEFYFRVKFYVSDPSKLGEEYTRYHFFLQLKKDLLEGRLACPHSTSALLSSYAIQSELGDYNPEDHKGNYLTEFRFIPSQTVEFERQVIEYHKQHRGQTPAEAEYCFLERAKRLEMYGVDLHNARDQSNLEIQLGVTSAGLVVFQNFIKINTFSWAKIVKISFKRKQFFIQLRREVNDTVENLIGFNMVSYRSCKNLWKSCVEHHTFFRLHAPNPPSKKIFSLGSKFRYSGKTEYQTLEESKRRAKIERSFSRSPSKRYARRTVGGVTRSTISEERNTIDGCRNLPKSHTFASGSSNSYQNFNRCDGSLRSTLPCDYKSRMTWADNNKTEKSDDDGGFLSRGPSTRNTGNYTTDPDTVPESLYDLPAYNDGYMSNGNGYTDSQGLVTIKMKPDEQGKFGFNVKGGSDQCMPIIVSRVAPNTPADLCIPRLNEGDQVLFINGRDVSQHTHEQVVMFIKASRETHSGELVLIIRPNVYVSEDNTEEPDLMYIPETHQIASTMSGANTLQASMMLLQESLESGAAMAQFEQLYRKKHGLTMNAARLPANISKNRYRDVSPYDQTRVILKGSQNGDYINANFVNMEIPGSGIINRYIAAQGPLPNTCADFWQMVWEQHCTLVVMLTTKVERGRVKCHQYWPDLYETTDFGILQITCVKEEETLSFAFREFTLTHVETNQERHIKHMQYIAWPDHGVPDDPADFLDFVIRVRKNRIGMVEPTVVHCSAGIGRTGVLITMETAMCLVEANQTVFPLAIVRQMRDQRAMLIQTASQYKFVCEAILRVYHETVVQPLDDYQR